MLLSTVKDEFVFHCQSRNLSPKTTKNYRKQIEYLLNYLAAEYQVTHIEDVKPEHIKTFLVKMKVSHKVNYINDLLKAFKVIRQALLNEKKIPQEIKIFLTTSQNKEGVNIEDDDINIMFSESSERSSLIQMAGRVRKGVDILAIIYDARQHSSRITETSMLLDYCCLDGVRDFWEIACITDLSKGIQDIEKKFDNIRYSYFKKNFFYYLGRELGIEQARADARFLKKCIEEWDWPPIVENDDILDWFIRDMQLLFVLLVFSLPLF